MNRLEKKCFVTAAGAHGLLLLILFIGPAFFMQSEKTEAFKPITVFDPNTISRVTQGGDPQPAQPVTLPPPAAPAEPKPVIPTPKPPELPPQTKPEVKVKDLETPKPEIKIKPLDKGDEPVVKPKKRTPQINPDELIPNKNTADKVKADKRAEDERRAHAQAVADQRQRDKELSDIRSTIRSLNNNLKGNTVIPRNPGDGGGGPASVSYFQLIQTILDNAWHPSQTLGEDTPTGTISITISRDGTLRGHISKHSGNASMDRSIQNVLDTVTSVEPFPASFSEQQITASFTFDIKAKR